MKRFLAILFILMISIVSVTPMFAQEADAGAAAETSGGTSSDASTSNPTATPVPGESIVSSMGVNLLEDDIDYVIFKTNEFLTSPTFTGSGGPFRWILMICLALSSLFCLILVASMAFKMMVKHEGIEVLKLLRPLGISIVLAWWYPNTTGYDMDSGSYSTYCVLDLLAEIPNAIGSYTAALYDQESMQVKNSYEILQQKIELRDEKYKEFEAQQQAAADMGKGIAQSDAVQQTSSTEKLFEFLTDSEKAKFDTTVAGVVIMIDKILMFCALLFFRIGWWGVIYCQQILLAVLTIFGPIHWAMSLLPTWQNAWSKWIGRYISVHFYGAMLYFVGFYVLLLFDIVLSIQIADLDAVLTDPESFVSYIKNCLVTSGYLMVASCVSLKCLGMVPDLASWIFPEGEVAFAARTFGADLAGHTQGKVAGMTGGIGRIIS